jgi:hypothetical protein
MIDPDLLPERRSANRVVKLKALIIVAAFFTLALIIGDTYPKADKYIHLSVIGYLGARIFLRGL